MDIIICGCVKDCEKYLDKVFENIKEIQNICNVKKIVLAYDNSNDKTLFKLCMLKKSFDIEILINKEPLTKIRTQNICNARNKLLDYLKNITYKIDYFIMMDFDDVCSTKMNIDVFKSVFDKEELNNWDCVSFNNERYYDYWALSIDNFEYSCWHWNNPKKMIVLMHNYLKMLFNSINKDYITCQSAFNGFAIYKYEKFINCEYKSLIDYSIISKNKIEQIAQRFDVIPILKNDVYDCEHRYFHISSIKKNNSKIVIYKKYLFQKYTGEHGAFLYD
jgi:hypothetical protein